jgi:uncharacterized protein involved in exopolysaccharide biosynthesis
MDDSVNKENAEKEISLVELIRKLWNKRRFIIKACVIGGMIGLIVGFGIPKEYTTTVILAPKSSGTGGFGNIETITAMAGIDSRQRNTSDISPELYPGIAKSTPFLTGLLNLRVVDEKQKVNAALSDYLNEYQRKPWWSYVFGLPGKMIEWFSSKEENGKAVSTDSEKKIIVLTKEQKDILDALKEKINVSVDKKNGALTLSATMQSANISAVVADTLARYMQDYIISYRTEKSKQDLIFTQKLYDESQENYFKAQQKYAAYVDKHRNIVSASFRVAQERLQNEMNLAYDVYNQTAQQLQKAKIKVQDETPIYAVIQPAEIPLSASAPRKPLILIGCVFISLIGASFWIISGREFFRKMKKSANAE